MNSIKLLSCLGLAVVLASCTVGPNYHSPVTLMPGQFAVGLPATRPTTRSAAATRPVDVALWWKSLDDLELDSLVERAIQSNPDLDIALTRLQEARTEEYVISGGTLPSAEFSGAAAGGSGSNVTKGRVSAPLNAATNTQGLKEITQVVGFDAGWEIDLFGKYRRQMEAVGDDTQAAVEARNAVLIALISDVARAYADLRTIQLRLTIVRGAITTAQQAYDLVQTRFDRGLTNELDVALAKRQLATVQAQVVPLLAGIAQTQRRLAVLLGQMPDDLSAELQQSASLPQPPDQIQPGLPIDLLRRRPDIRQAERELAAATARIGVATANLFPRVILTAGTGLQGQGLGRTPAKSSFIWSVGPAAYWPLLDFGTLDAQIEMQDFQTRERLLDYRKTVLTAVEEVDNAFTNYTAQQNRLGNLDDALTAAERAQQLASDRYDRGLTNFLDVLDAQRALYDLQDQYATAQETVLLQFIALYKGLGGGWETYQTVPPIRRPQPAIVATFEQAGR